MVAAVKNDPSLAATPVVVLTSLGMGSSVENEGMRQYSKVYVVPKPVKQAVLLDAIMRVLERPKSGAEPALAASMAQATKAESPETAMPVRILLAEDNPINQVVALRQLKKLGYLQVDAVGNGREVLDALENQAYTLVLMDCQMPEMDGYETARRVREREEKGPAFLQAGHIPIVAMTAHALEGDREKCLSAGMDDYIAKPVRLEDLTRIVKRWSFERKRDVRAR